MIFLHWELVADVAAVAVVACFSPTYFANSALLAVIDFLLLVFVIVQRADGAIIGAEVYMAALTRL